MASPTAAAREPSRRKRKSRFSDAAAPSDSTPPPLKKPTTTLNSLPVSTVSSTNSFSSSSGVLDAAALAKAAAAKIASIIPDGSTHTNIAASTFSHPIAVAGALDSEEQARLEQEKQLRKEQIWKSVQEQMSHIKALLKKPDNVAPATGIVPSVAAAAAAAAAATTSAARSGFMPAPLLLDDQGRQIDEHGNVIAEATPSTVVTLKANKATVKKQNPYLSHRAIEKDDKSEVVDPRIKTKKRETRAAKSFSFVKQGTYVKQAENLRARDAKKMLAGFTSGRNPRGYVKQSIVALDEEKEEPAAQTTAATDKPEVSASEIPMELYDIDVPLKPDSTLPKIEWWDVDYLPKELRSCIDKFGFVKAKSRKENPDLHVDYHDMKLKYCGTVHVIEHPARVNLIVPAKEQPVALPLMLTAAERKKIRRQQRAEREKEKQDKIALGLLPAPEPKVKLSNMMRVLSEQAVSDPSAIEKKVREQVAQRQQNHEMRNLARKLTPEERREKKLRKIKQDAAGDIHVAVFRVDDLSNSQHRFKVDVNAQQYHLTGGVLMCAEDNLNLVVVEGGRKAIKHYTRLMLRRIKWKDDDDDDDDEDEDEQQEENQEQHPNKTMGCELVWQGIVPHKAFKNFRFQECRTTVTARKVMEAKNVAHYWDLVEKSRHIAPAV